MKYHIGPFHDLLDGRRIPDIPKDRPGDTPGETPRLLLTACQDAHRMPIGDQPLCEMGSQKTCGPGHRYLLAVAHAQTRFSTSGPPVSMGPAAMTVGIGVTGQEILPVQSPGLSVPAKPRAHYVQTVVDRFVAGAPE